jgi:hypothetical protein
MKSEFIDPILAGYAALIRELVGGDEHHRFELIARIAKMAHALQQGVATRVAEIDAGRQAPPAIQIAEEGDYLAGGGGGLFNYHQPRVDSMDMVREIMGAFQPVAQMYMEREKETRLRGLCTVRASLEKAGQDTGAIDARIDKILGSMKETDNANSNVVHPDVLRGHSSGADGPRELQGPLREPDRGGEGGARAAAEDGDQERVDRPRRWLDLDGDDDDRRADRQGGGRPFPRSET